MPHAINITKYRLYVNSKKIEITSVQFRRVVSVDTCNLVTWSQNESSVSKFFFLIQCQNDVSGFFARMLMVILIEYAAPQM